MDSASHASRQSTSQAAADPDPHPSYFASALGVLIALTTIAFPLFAIAHFSAADSETDSTIIDVDTPQSTLSPMVHAPE